jgi:hypothetical protein
VKGHVAITKTRKLKLRTPTNYLHRKCYLKVFPKKDNILLKYSQKTNWEFNIITSVPLDTMHTIYHNCLDWLFKGLWFEGKLKPKAKFSNELMESLESKFRKVKGRLPYAIQTAALGTKRLEKFAVNWSVSEKRNFILYVAIVIMKDDLMDPRVYKIILALHHALMLLSGSRHLSTVPEQFLKKAEDNLLYVVEKCQQLYDSDFPRYTFHCLVHIVQDLRANRCRLDYLSMFKYENALRFFVHVLEKRSGARVHAQIRNALLRKKISSIVLPAE